MKKEVFLVGQLKKFEIWDKEKWEDLDFGTQRRLAHLEIKPETERMLTEIWDSDSIKQLVIDLKKTKNEMERRIKNVEEILNLCLNKL